MSPPDATVDKTRSGGKGRWSRSSDERSLPVWRAWTGVLAAGDGLASGDGRRCTDHAMDLSGREDAGEPLGASP